MHHLIEHINQDIKRKQSKDKDLAVNKTEYNTWAKEIQQDLQFAFIYILIFMFKVGLTTAKASGP